MLRHYRIRELAFVLCVTLTLAACSDPIQFSPFEAKVLTSETALTEKNLNKLALNHDARDFTPFRFIVTADTHSFYDDLKDAVAHMNLQNQIDFLAVAGDLTDSSLIKEFRWTNDILSGLNFPYITTIGNHDAIANGQKIYQRMFGALDYVFVHKRVKFIVLNTNSWEFNDQVPKLDWLADQFKDDQPYQHTLVISHIGPYDERFVNNIEHPFRQLLAKHNVSLYIHGHQHNFLYVVNRYADGVDYLINGSVSNHTYNIIDVTMEKITVEVVPF